MNNLLIGDVSQLFVHILCVEYWQTLAASADKITVALPFSAGKTTISSHSRRLFGIIFLEIVRRIDLS